MKLAFAPAKYVLAAAVAVVALHPQVSAFAPQFPVGARTAGAEVSSTRLSASRSGIWAPIAGAVAGFALASQVATAAPVVPQDQTATATNVLVVGSSSVLAADGMSLDFSMPSYNPTAKSSGFGDGTEAYLSGKSDGKLTDPGSDEKQKQMESMRKAEEARKERIAAEKQKQKEREEQDKIRAAEKKAERERRLKGIFD